MAAPDIQPYTISVSDTAIKDLNTRLSLAKFPDELDEAAWDLGAPLADVKRLTAYWKDQFSWRTAEQNLNKFPHYTTSITVSPFSPLKIHFLHKKSDNPNAIPLLFVHGWPGSFIEASKIIDQLAQPSTSSSNTDQPTFHVVAISLPNFGFSEGPEKRGFAVEHYATVCDTLMQQLSYPEYVTQGGDWGYYVTRAVSLLFPSRCKATHLNFDFGDAPIFKDDPFLALQHAVTPYTAEEKAGLARTKIFDAEGSSYRAQQSTKPQTLGYALSDSPVALLAWIYEKLHDWTDAYPWTDDEVCTWVSIYWFSTAGPAASLRIYYEATHKWPAAALTLADGKKVAKVTRDRVANRIDHVKIGLSHSPRELRVLPNAWTKKQGNIVFERYHESGGHFFAWERPEHLLRDVREMFGKKGGAYGVVKGKDGYRV